MRLKVLRADPAGNITLFVLTPVERKLHAEVAARLLASYPELQGEQVGFAGDAAGEGEARLDMAGGEFCGNATRAFGMLLARERGEKVCRLLVEASGCDHPVRVDVDISAGTARAEMPLPREVRPVTACGKPGTLVHLGGIAHLVVEGVEPSQEFFDGAEPLFRDMAGLEAYGVMFLNEAEDGSAGNPALRVRMTPLVKVPSAGTLFWEGSCGSGSLAAAAAQLKGDGELCRDYHQPAGTVRASVLRRDGKFVSAHIDGPVSLGEVMELDVEL